MITYDSLLVDAMNGKFFENLEKDPKGGFEVLKALQPKEVNSLLLTMIVGYAKLHSYNGKREDKEKMEQLFAEDIKKLQEISAKIQLLQILKGITFVTTKSLEGLKELAAEMNNPVIIEKANLFSNMLVLILPKKREMDNKLSTEAGEAITPVFAAAAAVPSPVNPTSAPAPASTVKPTKP